MKKFLFMTIAALTAISLTGSAEAKTPGTIKTYDNVEFQTTGYRVAFGQIFSPKDACSVNRPVKLTVKNGKKSKTLDVARSSAEGALSGFYNGDKYGIDEVRFVAPKTKECAAVSASAAAPPPVEVTRRDARKAVGTLVAFVGVDGIKQNGATAGLILLDGKVRCFANRKTKLLGDGELLDHGKTSSHGSYALHLTAKEFDDITEFQVRVAEGKAPDGTKCDAGSVTITESPEPQA